MKNLTLTTNKKTLVISVLLVLIILGAITYYYFYSKKTVSAITVAPTTLERVETITGGKAEVVKDVPKKTSEWGMVISLASLPQDIILTKELWMENPNIYEKEISDLEKNQKDKYNNQLGTLQKLSESKDLIEQFVDHTNGEIVKLKKYKEDQTTKQKNDQIILEQTKQRSHKDIMVQGRTVPVDQILSSTKNMSAIINLLDDKIVLIDLLISLKEQTRDSLQKGDIDLAGRSANDEDTVSLVASWHEKGELKLREEIRKVFFE